MTSKLAPTPKVSAAVIGGIIASAVLANVTLITPDLFDGLGKWSGLVYGLTITLVMGAAGWLKSESDSPATEPTDKPAEAPTAGPVILTAPASTFPAAKVEAAASPAPEPVVEPVTVTPVFDAPAAPVA